jgi:hypothetical protein
MQYNPFSLFPLDGAISLHIELPDRLEMPELELPAGFCFASDGEERVRKGDEEIIAVPRERFGDNEPYLTEEQVDIIFRSSC